ncbi:MAG: hypothetical protein ABL958_14630, partial [Bdellovibrionia bacterium]
LKAEPFTMALRTHAAARIALITNYADVEAFIGHEFFWPDRNSEVTEAPLEAPLRALLKEKRERNADSPAWKYDPLVSEEIHKALKTQMHAVSAFPTEFTALEHTWQLFTSRGVSTVTDDMLATLLKIATPEQIIALEKFAAEQDRVFDQGLRDEFAVRQIKRDPKYKALMDVADKPGTNREKEIREFIVLAQTLLSDLGIRYVSLMEEVSVGITSTYQEAFLIHDAKAKRLIEAFRSHTKNDKQTDSRKNMFSSILPHVKKWKPQQQYQFLLYLRGSIEATDFIKSQFPAFGPERIRKIFQGLPLEVGMWVVDMYLSETLLARGKPVNKGYGKVLMNYLIGQGGSKAPPMDDTEKPVEHDANERELENKYARLMLEGLLTGIASSGIPEFQSKVLSALIVMRPDENSSIGETMKMILEQFPGVGPKIGQFMVATGLLRHEINRILVTTQDGTQPPTRWDMYSDIERISGSKTETMDTLITKYLGGGSLKYSAKTRPLQGTMRLAVQIFREDVQNSADFQIKVLNKMVEFLIGKDPQLSFLKIVVDGAMNAVQREKKYIRESTKTAVARGKLYKGFSNELFTIDVPIQSFVNERMLNSRFASGGSFMRMTEEDRQIVGAKILEMEAKILFGNDKGVVWYDTDRHAGNYLVDVIIRNGKKHYLISPIDFGQLTYIRVDQRDRIADLFSLAISLELMGSNEWLENKIATMFELNATDKETFVKLLRKIFPGGVSEPNAVTSYFSLLAALSKTVEKPDIKEGQAIPDPGKRHRDLQDFKLDYSYVDFIRAIIQLNQYEERITIPDGMKTPQMLLSEQVKDRLAKDLAEVELSTKQSLYLNYVNVRGRVEAWWNKREYTPVTPRISRQDLDKFKLFSTEKVNDIVDEPIQPRDEDAEKRENARQKVLAEERNLQEARDKEIADAQAKRELEEREVSEARAKEIAEREAKRETLARETLEVRSRVAGEGVQFNQPRYVVVEPRAVYMCRRLIAK